MDGTLSDTRRPSQNNETRARVRPGSVTIFGIDYYAAENGLVSPLVRGCVVEVANFCIRSDSSFVCSEKVSYASRVRAFQISANSNGVWTLASSRARSKLATGLSSPMSTFLK